MIPEHILQVLALRDDLVGLAAPDRQGSLHCITMTFGCLAGTMEQLIGRLASAPRSNRALSRLSTFFLAFLMAESIESGDASAAAVNGGSLRQ